MITHVIEQQPTATIKSLAILMLIGKCLTK